MFDKNNLLEIKPFTELQDSHIKDIIKKANKKFFEKFSIFNQEAEIIVKNVKLYEKTFPHLKLKVANTTNPHQDLANFRLLFEWEVITRNFNIVTGVINIILIDVGASTRLLNSYIARVVLRPVLDTQDYIRINKFVPYVPVLVYKLTLQEFIKKNLNLLKDKRVVFNFTDVMYYIDENTLFNLAVNMHEGLIMTGTTHVFHIDNNNTIEKLLDYGYVSMKEHLIYMKVIGNETTYKHKPIFSLLLKNDSFNIRYNHIVLTIIKQNSINLEATNYISFVVIKSKSEQYSESIKYDINNGDYLDSQLLQQKLFSSVNCCNNEEKIIKNNKGTLKMDEKAVDINFAENVIKKTIDDYMIEKNLTYSAIYDNLSHQQQIKIRLALQLPQENLEELIKKQIFILYINSNY
jgi:hypothetical protein